MANMIILRYMLILLVSSSILYIFYNILIQHIIANHVLSRNYASYYDIPDPKVEGVNCRALFLNEESGIKYENKTSKVWSLPDEHYRNISTDCSSFIQMRKYIMRPINIEEATYPLAFSLVVYKNVHQVEQLLRAIYRPQNYYCIHVDTKAQHSVYEALSNIARCFNNVVMSSQRFDVKWGEYSVLQPELTCMGDLWNGTDWKYFINLTGQEFPLKTILEIVQILKAFNGSNAIGVENSGISYKIQRVMHHFHHRKQGNPKGPAPNNMTLSLGPLHVALTRGFVDFVLHHRIAKEFKQWIWDTDIPDETFFASLHVNPKLRVPGAYTGDIMKPWSQLNPFTRYKLWSRCASGGLLVHGVCILGVHYLEDLAKTPGMFANKFFPEYQPAGRMCLEELIFNRTRAQMKKGFHIRIEPYRHQLFVKQHAPS